MKLFLHKTNISAILALTFLSSTESFATAYHQKLKNQYHDTSQLTFTEVRGGFFPPNVAKTSKAASLRMTAATGVSGGGKGESVSVGGGTTTIPNEILNLVKNIVGAGVLSLPAGELNIASIQFIQIVI